MADGSGSIGTVSASSGGGGGATASEGFNLVSQGVQDFANAAGLKISEKSYKEEAALYGEAAAAEKSATNIQVFQQQRQAAHAIGGQKAAIASSGFLESGSSLDILRESAVQASIGRSMIEQQGLVKEQSDLEQQEAALASARAASKAAVGSEIAGGIDAAAAIVAVAAA